MTIPRFLNFVFFLITSQLSYSQTLPIIEDFNNDGLIDSLLLGSTEANSLLQYKDGTKENWIHFSKNNHYSEFIDFMPIPEFLLKPENEIILDKISNILFEKYDTEDKSESLQWLLDGFKYKEETVNNLVYESIYKVPINWTNDLPSFPKVTAKIVNTDSLKGSYFTSEDHLDPPSKYGFLIYYGHNHRLNKGRNGFSNEYEKGLTNKQYQLLETSHGLIIKRKNQYAWIFHSDVRLTGGPTKLRFPSIHRANIHGHYVILHHKAPIIGYNQFFIINLKTGTIGNLRLPKEYHNTESGCILFLTDTKQLIIQANYGCTNIPRITTFSLQKIFKALE